ncbi:hypothetical protein [Pseudonocardia sp. WMMC193]|uniref:hypothetical protein n=1 Tax=Pseudonocardia sp. WMMC193 TaxID=2911965 RepID=UPI001F440364|nr:hypothetical protein [Pseudonocardia sp. WMMC193]MCF7548919.1 hypothetical protein [Pseudonocardia sp. WMMC193]
MDENERLAEAVRTRREELGLRQRDLSSHGGPSLGTTQNVEQARGNYSRRTFAQLDAALSWEPGTAEKILHGELTDLARLPQVLIHPDGREYVATDPGEINTLRFGHGYRWRHQVPTASAALGGLSASVTGTTARAGAATGTGVAGGAVTVEQGDNPFAAWSTMTAEQVVRQAKTLAHMIDLIEQPDAETEALYRRALALRDDLVALQEKRAANR